MGTEHRKLRQRFEGIRFVSLLPGEFDDARPLLEHPPGELFECRCLPVGDPSQAFTAILQELHRCLSVAAADCAGELGDGASLAEAVNAVENAPASKSNQPIFS